MLKAIAISDLHIKFINGVDKEWQANRYNMFIDDLIVRCAKLNAILIIAGDTLDSTNPKKEEVQVFLSLLHRLREERIKTLIASGNHESLRANSSILDYLELDKFPNVYYRRNYETDDCVFHLVNHDSLHSHQHAHSADKLNVLISHFRCNYNQFVTEEIDVEKFTAGYDLCIVGDIHDSFAVGNVVYTNNPLNKEFEGTPNNGFIELDINYSKISYRRVSTDYPSLRYVKMSADKYHKARGASFDLGADFYKFEVEGTPEELRGLLPFPRSILKRIPVLPSVLGVSSQEDEQALLEVGDNDEGLIGYMKSLKYSESYIADMMKELRRDLD